MKLLTTALAALAQATLVFVATAGLAQAQSDYPNKPVKVIVPFPPGGTSDIMARMAADELGKILKQPFLVENIGGGGGVIGAERGAKAPADGYTLTLTGVGSNAVAHGLDARAESIRQLGYSYAEMEKKGVVMPVVDVHCRYLRPAKYDDLLTVKTVLKELPVHHKVEFHHEIFNEKAKLVAAGKIILNFIEASSMKRTTMPVELLKKLQPYFD